MTQQLNLRDAERKAFGMTFQDGLWDIFLGLIISQFAIVPLLTDLGWGDFWSSMVVLPIYLLALWGMRYLKKFITTPRVGLVNYHQERKSKIRKITLITTATLLSGLGFGIVFFYSDAPDGSFFPAAFSIVAMVVFGGGAYFLDFPRLIIYGLLTALSPIIGQLLWINYGAAHHGFPITFGISAAVMIIVGVFMFIRFLQRYPHPTESTQN
ncbi:MAG: hypothetical protein ISR58_20525 [Anaerolineales bacterium]|nr:hypothetical protein [Chloroflexota bacterium]MBL6983574.1 hypothetical protein [Anaerolineales bacterium]